MDKVKIKCRKPGLIFTNINPNFRVDFSENTTQEVDKEVADILLKNSMIEEVGKEEARKTTKTSFTKPKEDYKEEETK